MTNYNPETRTLSEISKHPLFYPFNDGIVCSQSHGAWPLLWQNIGQHRATVVFYTCVKNTVSIYFAEHLSEVIDVAQWIHWNSEHSFILFFGSTKLAQESAHKHFHIIIIPILYSKTLPPLAPKKHKSYTI